MTGTTFVQQCLAGTNMCGTGFHPCSVWEAMVLDELANTPVFDQTGWIAGSFPNLEAHMRSLVNGQHSTVCPAGSYIVKYPSNFHHAGITSRGGIHCNPETGSLPVWCCRDRT
jgi:hypothetical protein